MKSTIRLYAAASRFLEPGAPTGLTGVFTHPSPRSTLLYLYSTTLSKLAQLPQSSVYRQSTEALTKHRLSIVQATKPEGLSAWQDRVKAQIESDPAAKSAFQRIENPEKGAAGGPGSHEMVYRAQADPELPEEWDGEEVMRPMAEGPTTEYARRGQGAMLSKEVGADEAKVLRIEPEPPLTAEQIDEVEQKIGAGLIEEVIMVAEGERKLIDVMLESKVWEELEVKPTEGQWAYYERDRHTPGTQAR
ncbi:hypothetical protein LTR50_000845 [Elasticomyces elasticus]|nr:hypothetical protein LTR50_000845 [Elasticomyces elasticus]